MLRCFTVTAVLILAMPRQSAATVNIWLSASGTTSVGSAFPATAGAVPIFEPYLGGSGTVYIWGRPDSGKALVDLSLNLVAETQPICAPSCSAPNAIAFTSATMFNSPFGAPARKRFEYVDDSTNMSPLPITANRIDGIEGLRIFEGGPVPAVGVGSFADPLYDAAHNSWLIAAITYNVLATAENSDTYLFLEIGPVGLNHAGETTIDSFVVFGDATDVVLNGHANRGVHPGSFDALIRPRILPGDANRNGSVELADYGLWKANFGSTTKLAADHNLNGKVDAADYVVWRTNLGLSAGIGGAVSVPESSTAVSVSVGMLALWAFRRPFFVRVK